MNENVDQVPSQPPSEAEAQETTPESEEQFPQNGDQNQASETGGQRTSGQVSENEFDDVPSLDELKEQFEQRRIELADKVQSLPPEVLSATSEEEFADALVEAELGSDAVPAEKEAAKNKAIQLIQDIFSLTGESFNEAMRKGGKGMNAEDILNALLVTSFSGRGGLGSGGNSTERSRGENAISATELWEKKLKYGPEELVKAIEESMGKHGLNENYGFLDLDRAKKDMKHLQEVVKTFYTSYVSDDEKWGGVQDGLSYYYDSGKPTAQFDEKTKEMFKKLSENVALYYPQSGDSQVQNES